MRFLPVEDAYDRWAVSYDACHNPMVFMASQAIRGLDVRGQRIFEFGCGTGRNLAAFAAAGAASVAGCDLSAGMLARARERCPAAALYRHDVAGPPLEAVPAGSVDLAVFSLSLEHVADLAAALGEARRVVEPDGGRIAIFEIHPFLSLGGVAAHFEDEGGEVVRMPTVAHQFGDYLTAFASLGLAVTKCLEWRPRDLGAAAEPPVKVLKRGPDFPLLVEFGLEAKR